MQMGDVSPIGKGNMAEPLKLFLIRQVSAIKAELAAGWAGFRTNVPGLVTFWLLALGIGVAAGFAALLFRLGIGEVQAFLYGVDDPRHLHSYAQNLPWYWVLLIPAFGGLVVGAVLNWFTFDGRVRSVADVIEGAALFEGRVERRAGIGSAIASFITLSAGGSSGREGPVVHLAAVMASIVSVRLRASGITARDLMGCAVAAAVSASFNAPIAGAIFALEVVLRHFAIRSFAPIAIASISGTIINRMKFGDVTEFRLVVDGSLAFNVELPAFLLLGLVSGLVAVVFMRSVFFGDDLASWVYAKTRMPRILRPALAGLMLGGIAIYYPHIIGVGYETTSAALTGELVLHEAIIFAIIKVFAVSVTMGGRMGGGIFSPSLMLGALTGLAFGMMATAVFPNVSGSETIYALAGMGAVAAAVLGAPISTTLIVFELTGDWQTGIAVMAAVSIASALSSRLVHRSFFLSLLERRNVHLSGGPQAYLLSTLRVAAHLRAKEAVNAADEATCWEMIEDGIYVDGNASLEVVMPVFDGKGVDFIPVITLGGEGDAAQLWGAVFHVDALKAYNSVLSATAREEHA